VRVAIIGSRNFTDWERFQSSMSGLNLTPTVIISGGAKGADSLAEQWARLNGIATEVFLPDWKRYGRGAGMIRNQQIIDSCDIVVAFWDGSSPGTRNSIGLAKQKGIPVIHIQI
jgi:hypothetical protein